MLTIADLRAGHHALSRLTVRGKQARALADCIDRYERLIAAMEARKAESNQAPEAK